MQTASMLTVALEYCKRGWEVFPLEGKKPRVAWKDSATADQAKVWEWWNAWPDAGIGLALGKRSGVVRVDVDNCPAEEVARWELDPTLEFSTPAGGRGLLYRWEEGAETKQLWRGKGEHEELRLQSDGAYTVLPPSPHPEKPGIYEWVNDVPLSSLPKRVARHLYDLRLERVLRDLEKEVSPTVVDPGMPLVLEALANLSFERCDCRDTWLRVGMALHSAGDEYLQHWVEWSRKSPKFADGECEKLWAGFTRGGRLTVRTLLYWAKQDGWAAPRLHEPLTDVGNGRVLARACNGRAAFCRKWDSWLAWDGRRWQQGAALDVENIAKEVVRQRYEKACRSLVRLREETSDDESAKVRLKSVAKVLSWCMTSESARHIHAAVDMAKSEPTVAVDADRLDQHRWLFNCVNGTVDLRTGELRPHDPGNWITQLSPVEYDDSAIAPRWKEFLSQVFDGKPSVVAWLQKFLGYCLTGSVQEHVLPIFWGSGRNGKSTLVRTVFSVLGPDYASKAPRELLVSQKHPAHPTVLATLFGKRFVAAIETADGTRLDEVIVKELTGGDEITCRRMHEDFWSFRPSHKIALATNHQPEVRGTDHAIWSRLKLVPFTVVFSEERRDAELPDKLLAEAPGILAWMVEGCLRWQKEGLGDVQEVKDATSKYNAEQDKLESFLSACCVRRADARLRFEKLMQAYTAWCVLNKHTQLNGNAFGRALTEKGFAADGKYRLGIDLQTE